jgi:heat shock protein HslJ
MKGTHLLAFAGLVLGAGLAGCSSSPEKPADESQVSDALEEPFTASGNEPFWRVIVEPGQLVLERPGMPSEELRYKIVSKSETGRRFRASKDGLLIEMVTAPQLCRDSMTGMPHPAQVRLSVNGDVMSGCGGDPERLLTGAEWIVANIDGGGMVDKSRATIQFMPDGGIAGSGSCNRYTGQWSLSGEALEIGKLAITRKACPPELMDQEDRFLRKLESARAFDISPQGAVLISSDSQLPLRAFRATR